MSLCCVTLTQLVDKPFNVGEGWRRRESPSRMCLHRSHHDSGVADQNPRAICRCMWPHMRHCFITWRESVSRLKPVWTHLDLDKDDGEIMIAVRRSEDGCDRDTFDPGYYLEV